jgi:hypothetical protein
MRADQQGPAGLPVVSRAYNTAGPKEIVFLRRFY